MFVVRVNLHVVRAPNCRTLRCYCIINSRTGGAVREFRTASDSGQPRLRCVLVKYLAKAAGKVEAAQ